MKTLEMNEKSRKNQGGTLTKLLISSQLLIALEYQACYQSNAKTKYSHLIVKFEKNLLCIFMTFMKTLEYEKSQKNQGVHTYKIPPISLTNGPSLLNLLSKKKSIIQAFYSLVRYADYLIYIFININGNIRN